MNITEQLNCDANVVKFVVLLLLVSYSPTVAYNALKCYIDGQFIRFWNQVLM